MVGGYCVGSFEYFVNCLRVGVIVVVFCDVRGVAVGVLLCLVAFF